MRREVTITPGRIEGLGRRGKGLTADYVLEYRNTKLPVVEAKPWDAALTEGVARPLCAGVGTAVHGDAVRQAAGVFQGRGRTQNALERARYAREAAPGARREGLRPRCCACATTTQFPTPWPTWAHPKKLATRSPGFRGFSMSRAPPHRCPRLTTQDPPYVSISKQKLTYRPHRTSTSRKQSFKIPRLPRFVPENQEHDERLIRFTRGRGAFRMDSQDGSNEGDRP